MTVGGRRHPLRRTRRRRTPVLDHGRHLPGRRRPRPHRRRRRRHRRRPRRHRRGRPRPHARRRRRNGHPGPRRRRARASPSGWRRTSGSRTSPSTRSSTRADGRARRCSSGWSSAPVATRGGSPGASPRPLAPARASLLAAAASASVRRLVIVAAPRPAGLRGLVLASVVRAEHRTRACRRLRGTAQVGLQPARGQLRAGARRQGGVAEGDEHRDRLRIWDSAPSMAARIESSSASSAAERASRSPNWRCVWPSSATSRRRGSSSSAPPAPRRTPRRRPPSAPAPRRSVRAVLRAQRQPRAGPQDAPGRDVAQASATSRPRARTPGPLRRAAPPGRGTRRPGGPASRGRAARASAGRSRRPATGARRRPGARPARPDSRRATTASVRPSRRRASRRTGPRAPTPAPPRPRPTGPGAPGTRRTGAGPTRRASGPRPPRRPSARPPARARRPRPPRPGPRDLGELQVQLRPPGRLQNRPPCSRAARSARSASTMSPRWCASPASLASYSTANQGSPAADEPEAARANSSAPDAASPRAWPAPPASRAPRRPVRRAVRRPRPAPRRARAPPVRPARPPPVPARDGGPGLVDPPHQDPGPAHQDPRRLPHPRAALGVQRENPLVRLGDRGERLVDLSGERADVRPAGACRQRLTGVARLRVQRGRQLEECRALRAAFHGPVVGDLRTVARRQLGALGGPRDAPPTPPPRAAAGVRQPPRLGEQRGQVRAPSAADGGGRHRDAREPCGAGGRPARSPSGSRSASGSMPMRARASSLTARCRCARRTGRPLRAPRPPRGLQQRHGVPLAAGAARAPAARPGRVP